MNIKKALEVLEMLRDYVNENLEGMEDERD